MKKPVNDDTGGFDAADVHNRNQKPEKPDVVEMVQNDSGEILIFNSSNMVKNC